MLGGVHGRGKGVRIARRARVRNIRIDGKVPSNQRQSLVDKFQACACSPELICAGRCYQPATQYPIQHWEFHCCAMLCVLLETLGNHLPDRALGSISQWHVSRASKQTLMILCRVNARQSCARALAAPG